MLRVNPYNIILHFLRTILFLSFSAFSLGQSQENIDRAQALMDELKFVDAEIEMNKFFANPQNLENKKLSAKAYDLMADLYHQTGRSKKMFEYNSKLLPLAIELKDTLMLAQVYNRFGIYEMDEGNFKSSENYYLKALALGLEKKDLKKAGEIYNNLASTYMNAGDKEKAIDWFFKTLKIREKIGDQKGLGETYSNIASLYFLSGKVDDAINYQKQSIQIREKIKDYAGLVITHLNIGQLYIAKNQMNEAYVHLKKSVDYAEDTQNEKLMGSAYFGIAVYYSKNKENEKSLIWYKKAIKIFEEADNKTFLSRLYVAAANVAKEIKDTTSASHYYQKALDLSLALKNKENISNAYEKLSLYYEELNKPSKALEYYKNFIAYRDSISATSNLAKIEEIRAQYETEKKDNEILKLQTEQKIRDLQIEKQKAIIAGNEAEAKRIQNEIELLAQTQALNDLKIKQQQEDLEKQTLLAKTKEQELLLAQQQKEINERKLIEQKQFKNILIGGILALLIIGGILFNRYKLQKKLEQQETLLAVRNHIARDLHDKVGSTLTGIKVLSEVSAKTLRNDNDKTLAFIEQIIEQTKSIQQEMSDIVWAINPNNDKIENLVTRMREYLAQTLEPNDMHIQMNVSNEVLDHNLNMNSRKEFFLIFREAVNNIAKHSEAKKVEISVEKIGNNIRMKIEDDGKGFDLSKETSSNGLKNMKERAHMLNGSFSLDSEVGKGTKILLEFPST